MTFTKNSPPFGKKQASMPRPNSAAYKTLAAATGAAPNAASVSTAKSVSSKSSKKSAGSFASLKSRQRIVERVKRAIWASVLEINDAIINLALCGNYNAARALFDFAGVYSLPAPENDGPAAASVAAATVPPASAEVAAHDPIDAFFRSIGVEPPCEPAPDLVAASL